ncbi:MAG TPA: hypothetical protein VGE18_02385 [Candidatus Paceibacterota bacterium]
MDPEVQNHPSVGPTHTSTLDEKITAMAHELHVEVPEGALPLSLKLVCVFTLIGGLSIIGSLFVDIIRPSNTISAGLYIMRLAVGVTAVGAAYGIIRKERWTMWFYGVLMMMGLFLNPVTAVIPALVLVSLYRTRHLLAPSKLDLMIEYYWEVIKNKLRE